MSQAQKARLRITLKSGAAFDITTVPEEFYASLAKFIEAGRSATNIFHANGPILVNLTEVASIAPAEFHADAQAAPVLLP